jgi:hypothetical protein
MRAYPSTFRRPLALLATLAIVGQVVLLASALLLPLVSEYSLSGDTMSELVLGRFGWVQTVAFIVAGLGTLALAYALRQLTAGTWGSLVGPLLVGVYGVGALLTAVFPTDRVDTAADVWAQSTTGMIHLGISLISFPAMIVAMFVLVRTFHLEPRWRSLSPWIALFPVAALALFLLQSATPWVGIMQRLLVAAIAGWMVVVVARILALDGAERRAAPARSAFSPMATVSASPRPAPLERSRRG